jgi:hypothetical protein
MTVRQPIAILITIIGAALAAGACSEHLNGGAACPTLCPGQSLQIIDTTFRIDHGFPVEDTTIASFPQLGDEGELLVARIPNLADVRGILRFDSLGVTYSVAITQDSTFDTTYTSAIARDPVLWFAIDTRAVAATRGSDRVELVAYEVDTTADTTVSVLASLFTQSRLLGASTPVLASALEDTTNSRTLDTVMIHLDSVAVLNTLLGDRKLRVGLMAYIVNFPNDAVRLTVDESTAPFVRYYGSADSVSDTTYARISSNLRSTTPIQDSTLLSRLIHYPLIVQGALPDSADQLNVGGIPSRRVFMRFGLPSQIIDTSNVIRMSLLLTERPQPLQIPGDTSVLYPWPVVSSNKVMTPAEATNFIVSSSTYSLDSVQIVTYVSKVDTFEIVNAAHNWQNVADSLNTRSLVLRILNEGQTTLESSFWSSYAADSSVRPHVKVRYVKRSTFGLP